jgi:hypothetical protein
VVVPLTVKLPLIATLPLPSSARSVQDAVGKTYTALLPAECGAACNVCACAFPDSQ